MNGFVTSPLLNRAYSFVRPGWLPPAMGNIVLFKTEVKWPFNQ
jgi:hypothetical protein